MMIVQITLTIWQESLTNKLSMRWIIWQYYLLNVLIVKRKITSLIIIFNMLNYLVLYNLVFHNVACIRGQRKPRYSWVVTIYTVSTQELQYLVNNGALEAHLKIFRMSYRAFLTRLIIIVSTIVCVLLPKFEFFITSWSNMCFK